RGSGSARTKIWTNHVQHTLSFRLADLGFSRCRLFHLWEKAEVVVADAWWSVDDRRLVFRRLGPDDVVDLRRSDGCHLHSPETGLLIHYAKSLVILGCFCTTAMKTCSYCGH